MTLCGKDYYEEVTLYGFVLGNIKDREESIYYLNIYKERIDNWASCDLFCSSYKIVKKNMDYYFQYINDNIKSDNMWIRRMCFVLLLSYYIDDVYLESIFELCDRYSYDSYYVGMAIAWLISVCYVKYPKRTILYLKNDKLNDFTHNKAISKIRESLRVSMEDKIRVNELKR